MKDRYLGNLMLALSYYFISLGVLGVAIFFFKSFIIAFCENQASLCNLAANLMKIFISSIFFWILIFFALYLWSAIILIKRVDRKFGIWMLVSIFLTILFPPLPLVLGMIAGIKLKNHENIYRE